MKFNFPWVSALVLDQTQVLNPNISFQKCWDFNEYSQGTVTITGTDDDQTITVDLSTEDGETTATATYQGSFQFVDYSMTKKNKKK